MATIKLQKKLVYEGTITLKTGLHIGGTDAALNIGGPDNFVVRNPLNNIPYIPGSSLKGKLRALIELKYGLSDEKGLPNSDPTSKAGALFGTAGNKGHASRVIFRDGELLVDDEYYNSKEIFKNTDLPYTETKAEVCINRVTGTSSSFGPRFIERVPAGAKFKLNMVLNIFEGEDEEGLKQTLKEAINLLENDYLGGHGSRGYGQVEVNCDIDHPEVIEY